MLNFITNAYKTGWRAGMAEPVILQHVDGLKVLTSPECPYKGFRTALQGFAWHQGYVSGMYEKLARWLDLREPQPVEYLYFWPLDSAFSPSPVSGKKH